MKKTCTAIAMLGFFMPAMVDAAGFQPVGRIGMGGAGVAITTDSFATYWNPAGLAFHEKSVSARLNGGGGVNINSVLAENVDKLGRLDFVDLGDLNTSSSADALKSAREAVQFVGILDDIQNRGGTVAVNSVVSVAFQYRNFGTGAFIHSEKEVYVDRTNVTSILPADSNTSLSAFARNISAVAGRPQNELFTATQRDRILTAYNGNSAVVDTLERELASSNASGLSKEQLAQALIKIGDAFRDSNESIDFNDTRLAVKELQLTEIPFACGYRFDMKELGQLGLGGAVKVMMGTVSGSVINIREGKGTDNILKRGADSSADSTTFGIDLGISWRKDLPGIGPFNAGLVAKNLNSPAFDNPAVFSGVTKVDPQVRMGIAVDPLTWLTVAADMDMTKNRSVADGRDSQNLGFGAEFRPYSYLALRSGLYSNLADSSTGPAGTFGISLGPKAVRLDLDGSVTFRTAVFDNKSYPRDARVSFGLSTMF